MTGETQIDEVDRLRAQIYRLLGDLLARPPSSETQARLRGLSGDGSPLGQALADLAAAAGRLSGDQIEREFNALFIGVARGELLPFASYYLTGFLHEKPLARLRTDMQALGIVRAPGIGEPEDHLAALCQMMAGLIEGGFAGPVELSRQQVFFDRHLAPWAGRCCEDLTGAAAADFYRPVGRIGRLFLEIEQQAFALAA